MSSDIILGSLNEMILEAFKEKQININLIKEIVFKLKLIPYNEKHFFRDFVEDFLNKSFDRGYEVENLSISDFEEQPSEKKIQEDILTEKTDANKSIVLFKDLFDSVIKELNDYFINYKGYFITHLVNEYNLPYELIFIYEDVNSYSTLQKKVKKIFSTATFYELNGNPLYEKLDQGKNYICVFLLTSKVNNIEKLKNQVRFIIEDLVDKFNNFEYYTLTNHYSKKEKKERQIVKSNNSITRFKEDIQNFSSMFLSNTRLNFEEEKIIKKLCCRIKSNLIFYKILSGGFSGSKVIEIRPKKSYDQKKIYILKIGHLSDEKVSEERDNYDEYIPDGLFNNYIKPNYQYTDLYEGLMYDYAISKEANSSYSFSDHFDIEKFPVFDLDNMKSIVKELFDNELFEYWQKDQEVRTNLVSEIYGDYLSKKKIVSSLKSLLNDEAKENEFLIIFDKIWGYDLKYSETVCHGDLHSDNFFIDNTNKIFLIDFGHTKKRHSLIDYVALECSLKFKHFPFYLEREELEEIEKILLTDNTFDLNYNFRCSRRKDILNFLEIINTIRNCSKVKSLEDFSTIEYQIALFVLTIRQIMYPNMNQRYAYRSAKMIGSYIVDALKL